MMPSLTDLVDHWGYLAIFLVVTLGNVGLPVPEETILVLAGYLVWEGHLRLTLVLLVGVVSAVVGDNVGYWIGRRYGAAIERHGPRLLGTPARFEATRRFVARQGARGVFVARFVPGVRFVAGPLAGLMGLAFPRFFAANLLGAVVYVPVVVGAGYAVGYGLGDYVKTFERAVTRIEHVIVPVAVLATAALLAWRMWGRRGQPCDRSGPGPGPVPPGGG